MATIVNSGTLFPAALVTEMFSRVKGHSTLAKLAAERPMPFAGTENFIFSMDGEAAIVGEGGQKPAGDAGITPVTIKPLKVVYQCRISDEFMHCSEEKQLEYLIAFSDGFSKKIGRALDIMAFHGVNPATGTASSAITSCFATAITNEVEYDAAAPDENIDEAVQLIQTADGDINGIAMAPAFAAALGAMKASGTGLSIYPEYRFGGNPGNFGGTPADKNSTVSFGTSTIRAIVGDFANAVRWGYADHIPLKVIEYGDPDGQGDLQGHNQVVLRSEAYIGWGIMDPDAFALIKATA